MITVEVADPRSTESLFLIERLSLELTTITGDSGKSHFNVDSMDESGLIA